MKVASWRAAICIANFKHSKCNKQLFLFKRMPYSPAREATLPMEKVFLRARAASAHVVSQHSNLDGILPSLMLMSPSNFHKTHAFLRVTNTCYCLLWMMMIYTKMYRISFLLFPKPPDLFFLLPQSPLHMPSVSAAPLLRKLPTMCFVPRRPPEKDTFVWWLLAFAPLFLDIFNI